MNTLPVNVFIEAVALAKSSTLVSNEDEVNSILSNPVSYTHLTLPTSDLV